MLHTRYDARHLLSDGGISRPFQTDSGRLSPSGWSDLPSDAEDTFFFSASEKLRGCDRGLKENDGAQIQKWRCVCACCSTPCLLVLADASGGHVDVKPITVQQSVEDVLKVIALAKPQANIPLYNHTGQKLAW